MASERDPPVSKQAASENDPLLAQNSRRASGSLDAQPLLAEIEPVKNTALLTAAFACLSGVLLGWDIGVTAGAIIPIKIHFNLTDRQIENFVGVLNLTAFPGCFAGGFFADRCGRRAIIGTGASLFLVANATMTFAYDYNMLVIGRAIAGFAIGITFVTEPLYTAETSPARLRGGLSTNVEIIYQVGWVAGQIASWIFSEKPAATSWRWMMGLSLAFPVISLIGVLFVLPESPRWLASKDRLPEAETVLHWLLGPAEAQSVLKKLTATLPDDKDRELSWWNMFACKKMQGLLFIGGGVAMFSQVTGIETIAYYSNVILNEAGMSRNSQYLATLALGFGKFAFVCVCAFFIDSFGRRPLLLISSVGMAMSMGVLGLAFRLNLPMAAIYGTMAAFILFFSLGFGPITYVLNAELYPKSCRAKALVFSMALARVVAGLVSGSFLSLMSLLTLSGAFFFYAASGTISAAFVMSVVPETKGTHLEDQDIKQQEA